LIPGVAAARMKVSRQAVPVEAAVEAYSALIQPLLATVAGLAAGADGEVASRIGAYVALMRAKESAGLERAAGATGFGAGGFPPALHRRLIELAADQEAGFDWFRSDAGAAWTARLDAVLADSGDAARLREVAVG